MDKQNKALETLEGISVDKTPNFQEELNSYVEDLKVFHAGKKRFWRKEKDFLRIVKGLDIMFNGYSVPIKLLEDILSFYKKRKRAIEADRLPKLLKANQLKEITMEDGTKVTIKMEVSPVKKDEDLLFKWLEDNDEGHNIKDIIALGKGEFTDELESFLNDKGFSYEVKSKIEYQTLAKVLRDRINEEIELPPAEAVEINQIDVAKIK